MDWVRGKLSIWQIFILINVCVNGKTIDIANLCDMDIQLQNPSCSITETLECPGQEEENEITFKNKILFSEGYFPNDRFSVELLVSCSRVKTFHEITVKNITMPNPESSLSIGDGKVSNQNGIYSSTSSEDGLVFTNEENFWIVIEFLASKDFSPTIIIQATSVPKQVFQNAADATGIETESLERNAIYTWKLDNNFNSSEKHLTANFESINLSTTAGDILLVSDDIPFVSETIVMPYIAKNVTIQFRQQTTQVTLETGRHIKPLNISFKATFRYDDPITTVSPLTTTTTLRPPPELEYIRIVILGWEISHQLNDTAAEEVKENIETIVHCYCSSNTCLEKSQVDPYNIYLMNIATCLHSWTVDFENCTQAQVASNILKMNELKLALGDYECRKKSNYSIYFPEEMFDFYNIIAVPLAVISLAVIVVAILAIWRGTAAYYYRKQIKSSTRQYQEASSDDGKESNWAAKKAGELNEAFEAVEDDDDVIFDPTKDGSVYSRYSSVSGQSTYATDGEPKSVTYTSGRFPSVKRQESIERKMPYAVVPQTELLQRLQQGRASTASSANFSTTDL
ncbi:uncharacterized protein LOC136028944 isoform X2 [Artemia franciscana]|nr:hypothetical protein QYM36_014750 [Artemia franciscana]